MIKFKYSTMKSEKPLLTPTLSEFGDKGWELVQILSIMNNGRIEYLYTFIKELPIIVGKPIKKKNVIQRTSGKAVGKTPKTPEDGTENHEGNDQEGGATVDVL